MENTINNIVDWIKKQVKNAGAKGVIVGLSGGIDSSCIAALCKKAFPDNTKGVIMPCLSNLEDERYAKIVAEKLNIPFQQVNLTNTFKLLFKEIEGSVYDAKKTLANANLKPRLRMSVLYYFANKLNYLVVGTDNKSEEMIGYFTKYGDGGVDILPLVDLYKKDVRKLASFLGIPKEIIEKKPSAGLWDGQTDEDELGITYDELDGILEKIEHKEDLSKFDQEKVKKVKGLIQKSEHKRNMPPGYTLTDEEKSAFSRE